MTCPICKQSLDSNESLTLTPGTNEMDEVVIYVLHRKNGHWCWCSSDFDQTELVAFWLTKDE